MKRTSCTSFVLALFAVFGTVTFVKAQNYLEFDSSYRNCGVAMNYKRKLASSPCNLTYTYDGINLNFHFIAGGNDINMVTDELESGLVKVSNGYLYLSEGIYFLSRIDLKLSGYTKVSILGTGECKKSSKELVCIFESNEIGLIRFAGTAY
jgi:hypothetical protein